MTMILTNKSIEREEKLRKYKATLASEHHQLALDKALLLDFVYLVAASKRIDGEFSYDRDDLRTKAGEVLDSLNL